MKVVLQRTATRMFFRVQAMAFDAWRQAVHDRKLEDQLTTKEQLAVRGLLSKELFVSSGCGRHLFLGQYFVLWTVFPSTVQSSIDREKEIVYCVPCSAPCSKSVTPPLQIKCRELIEENERLRRDNERFVRLIDSGEWGRGRVAELVAAGEVLKGERDALLKLIQSLRHEYEAVQHSKVSQEEELRNLKNRMLLGVRACA